MNNPNATIVQLSGGNPGSLQVSTFEQAFEGYSNLKGKGRARRAKKKATKKANKQSKRMTRINNKQERKSTRKTNRQGNRLQHAQAKNVRKDEKQGGRLGRKANRKASRGRGIADVLPDEEVDDTLMSEEDTGAPQSEAGYEPQDGGDDNGGGEQEEVSAEQEATETDDTQPNDSVEYVEQTEEWAPEDPDADPDYGFNGEEAGSQFNNEVQENSVVIHISTPVRDTAKKIVWNEMKAHGFNGKIGKGGDDADLTAKRDSHIARAKQLEDMLSEYSNARGGRAAKQEIRAAKKEARQEARAAAQPAGARPASRAKAAPSAAASRFINRRKAAPAPAPKPVTPVEADLEPEIADNEITIPSDEVNAEFAGGTGTYAEEGIGANPADVRKVELTSGFDGKNALKNVNWKQVGVGVALAAGIIGILKVTKVI